MPQLPNPPFAAGAVSIPRTLNRWLDKNYLRGPLTRTHTYIVLPSFNVPYTWLGYSDIVAAFNFEAPNNFSLTGFLSGTPAQQQAVIGQQVNQFNPGLVPQVPYLPVLPLSQFVSTYGTPNYYLCISWRTVSGKVYRYALWNNVGEVLYFNPPPLYSGQLIKQNFRFEVWSTTQSSPAIQANPEYFYTSVLGQVDYRFGLDIPLVAADSISTNFSVLSSQKPGELLVSGAGSTLFNGSYYLAGQYGGYNYYIKEGYPFTTPVNNGNPMIFVNNNSYWALTTQNIGGVPTANYYSTDLPVTPDLVVTWNKGILSSLPLPTVATYASTFNLPFNWPAGSYSQPNPDDLQPVTYISGSQVPVLPSGAGTIIYNISSSQIVYYVNGSLPNPPNINANAIGVDPNGILPGKVWNITLKSWE
jgi:hypothetical protein